MSDAQNLVKCPACGQSSRNSLRCSVCSYPFTVVKASIPTDKDKIGDDVLATDETMITEARPQQPISGDATVAHSEALTQEPIAGDATVIHAEATVLSSDDHSEISTSFFEQGHLDKTPMRAADGSLPQTRQTHRTDLIGLTFGHCQVVEKIGQGGMALVYKAYHQTLDQYVVLKTLPPSMALSQELRERFIREARACARLHHQNIVQILDAGCQHGVYFYLMEFVDGESLEELLAKEKNLPIAECCRVIKDAAVGLALAHQHGIIHRDIKASNIMITRQGTVKVADFGLACDLSATRISRSGQMMGTPHYMSPEQWEGEGVDARSDLYSLGITFYYILAGQLPFDTDSTISLFKKHSLELPQPLRQRNPEIPAPLEAIVDCLLEKKPENRYPNAAALVAELERFCRGDAPDIYQKKKRNIYKKLALAIAVFLVLATAISLALIQFFRPKPPTSTAEQIKSHRPDGSRPSEVTTKPPIKVTTGNAANTSNPDDQKQPQPSDKQTGNKHRQPPDQTGKQGQQRQPPEKSGSDDREPKHRGNDPAQTANHDATTTATKAKLPKNNSPAKLAQLPLLDIKFPSYVRSFPLAIQGKLSDDLPAQTRLALCYKRIPSSKITIVPIGIHGRDIRLTLSHLDDGEYAIALFAIRATGKKVKMVATQMIVDTMSPKIRIIAPLDGTIYHEEKDNRVGVEIIAQDSTSGMAQVRLIDEKQRPLAIARQNGRYRARLTLSWGKQHFQVVSQDKAGNLAKAGFSLILVPAGMVRIPGGTIMVNDRPCPFTTFYIDRIEVTRAAFAHFLRASRATPPVAWEKQKIATNWQKLPVTMVSYRHADEYSRFFNKRLPTEAEWVAAALWDGKTQYSYPWGDDARNELVPDKLQPAGSWKSDCSPLGVYDMLGNVAEWTANLNGKNMATRKGVYYSVKQRRSGRYELARVSFKQSQDSQVIWLGFRCALSEE